MCLFKLVILFFSHICPGVELLGHMVVLWRRQWHPTPVLLPGKSHGQRSLVGCSPWGCEESDMTERLHFHFHALEKEMATHSSVLAWRNPWTEEPGRLQAMGLQRGRHDWRDWALMHSSSIFSFLRNFIPFSTVTASIYISTISASRFPFLRTLSSIYCL